MGLNISVENALIKSVSCNNEKHGENKKGALDIKVGMTLPKSQMRTILGMEDDLNLWHEKGDQLVKTGVIDSIKLSSEFEQLTVKIADSIELKNCKATKFEVVPAHGACFGVVFNIRKVEAIRGTIDDVLALEGDIVHLEVEGAYDLIDQAEDTEEAA